MSMKYYKLLLRQIRSGLCCLWLPWCIWSCIRKFGLILSHDFRLQHAFNMTGPSVFLQSIMNSSSHVWRSNLIRSAPLRPGPEAYTEDWLSQKTNQSYLHCYTGENKYFSMTSVIFLTVSTVSNVLHHLNKAKNEIREKQNPVLLLSNLKMIKFMNI